jgi:ferric-dicitrate binding protein FerR (iron transport regulator)
MSRKHADAVIPEAVRWFNRFRIKGPTALAPDESAEWARWSADAAHQVAFQQVEQLWKRLQHLADVAPPTQQELDTDGYDPERSIAEWLAQTRRKKASR